MRPRWRLFPVIAYSLCNASLHANDTLPSVDRDALPHALETGRYLSAYRTLEAFSRQGGGDIGSLDLIRSFIHGRDHGYQSLQDNSPCVDLGVIPKKPRRSAIRDLSDAAKKRKIVILNENHLDPRGRVFATRLARKLKAIGYTTLAVEGLTNSQDDKIAYARMREIEKRGYIARKDGVYTQEPAFSTFLYEAIHLGYHLMSYDASSTGGSGSRVSVRDQRQAENIARRWHPADGKLLVYVGFSHVAELPFSEPGDGPETWLAYRLKQITGIDPLTIDQTIDLPLSCVAAQPIASQHRWLSTLPEVALGVRGSHPVGPYGKVVDIQVIHLPQKPVHGRPAWLNSSGLTPIRWRQEGATSTNAVHGLVQIFPAGSGLDAAPLDQALIGADNSIPTLMSPTKKVRMDIQTGSEQ